MKAEYDKETDTLTITLRDARVKESDEIRPGVIADFGYDGGVVGFEVLEASKIVEKAGEWSRGDASDIDGQTERSKWAGAHESKRGHRMRFKCFLWIQRFNVSTNANLCPM